MNELVEAKKVSQVDDRATDATTDCSRSSPMNVLVVQTTADDTAWIKKRPVQSYSASR